MLGPEDSKLAVGSQCAFRIQAVDHESAASRRQLPVWIAAAGWLGVKRGCFVVQGPVRRDTNAVCPIVQPCVK